MAFVTILLRSWSVSLFIISSAVTAKAAEIRKTSSAAISVTFERSSATTPTWSLSLCFAAVGLEVALDGIAYNFCNTFGKQHQASKEMAG